MKNPISIARALWYTFAGTVKFLACVLVGLGSAFFFFFVDMHDSEKPY